MARVHAYDAAEGPKWEIYLSDAELHRIVEQRRADFVRGRDLTVILGPGKLAEVRVIIGAPAGLHQPDHHDTNQGHETGTG